jgi:cytochrome c
MTLRYPLIAVTLAACVLASPARANEDLAKKYQCLACHQTDKKLIGPAYREVAKKYKGQADAAVKMAEKIRKGSTGVWGPVPMPANDKVPDADAKTLAEWVLKQG